MLRTLPTIGSSIFSVEQMFVGVKVYTDKGSEIKNLDEVAYRYHLQRGELDIAPPWAESLMNALNSDDA